MSARVDEFRRADRFRSCETRIQPIGGADEGMSLEDFQCAVRDRTILDRLLQSGIVMCAYVLEGNSVTGLMREHVAH